MVAHRRRLEKAGDVNEAKTYDFMPETYYVEGNASDEDGDFERWRAAKGDMWIVKPARNSNKGVGIKVAELAGFPPATVQVAKRKAEELESNSGGKLKALRA